MRWSSAALFGIRVVRRTSCSKRCLLCVVLYGVLCIMCCVLVVCVVCCASCVMCCVLCVVGWSVSCVYSLRCA